MSHLLLERMRVDVWNENPDQIMQVTGPCETVETDDNLCVRDDVIVILTVPPGSRRVSGQEWFWVRSPMATAFREPSARLLTQTYLLLDMPEFSEAAGDNVVYY